MRWDEGGRGGELYPAVFSPMGALSPSCVLESEEHSVSLDSGSLPSEACMEHETNRAPAHYQTFHSPGSHLIGP